jgi:2-iminobutanoate/2-iminopropanoate deaminase
MDRTIVKTDSAPAAIGPYSQAVVAAGLVFCTGQIALDPQSGAIPPGLEAQTHRVLANLQAVLKAAGSDLSKVVKTTVFVRDMNDFAKLNAIYATYFKDKPPARSTVEVSRLPRDVLVEIEAIALSG